MLDAVNIHVFPGLEEPVRLLRKAAKLTEILDAVATDFCCEQGL